MLTLRASSIPLQIHCDSTDMTVTSTTVMDCGAPCGWYTYNAIYDDMFNRGLRERTVRDSVDLRRPDAVVLVLDVDVACVQHAISDPLRQHRHDGSVHNSNEL